jgi:hypothetical protein
LYNFVRIHVTWCTTASSNKKRVVIFFFFFVSTIGENTKLYGTRKEKEESVPKQGGKVPETNRLEELGM